MVQRAGLEPARVNHTHLKRTRLPIPPPLQARLIIPQPEKNVKENDIVFYIYFEIFLRGGRNAQFQDTEFDLK